MVMEKPIQFTNVSAVPLCSGGAFIATKVDNKGESATTIIPQNKRKAINTCVEPYKKNNGDNRHESPDRNMATAAVFLSPKYSET